MTGSGKDPGGDGALREIEALTKRAIAGALRLRQAILAMDSARRLKYSARIGVIPFDASQKAGINADFDAKKDELNGALIWWEATLDQIDQYKGPDGNWIVDVSPIQNLLSYEAGIRNDTLRFHEAAVDQFRTRGRPDAYRVPLGTEGGRRIQTFTNPFTQPLTREQIVEVQKREPSTPDDPEVGFHHIPPSAPLALQPQVDQAKSNNLCVDL